MHNFYNQFFSTVFCLLYMFRKSLVVHRQEHGIIYCIAHTVQSVQSCLQHKHVQQTKNCGIKKLIIRIVHLVGH